MGLYKNVASQKIAVYAHDAANDVPKTGDAANITAQLSKDFGAAAATNDTNPTELDATDHPGIYVFDLTQSETNADNIVISAVSSTADILLDPIQVFTVPPNFRALAIESDGMAHADLKEMLGDAQSLTDLKDFADAGYDPSTNKVQGVVTVDTVTALHSDYDAAKTAASQSSVDTIDDLIDTEVAAILAAVDTEVAAIKAKTDNLPSDPADASDIASSFSTVNSTLSTIAGYLDTEVAAILAAVDTEIAAIKAKTDNLPSDPADASDIAASFSSIASTLTTIAGYIDTEVASILTAVDTEVAAIKAKTDNLPSDPADQSAVEAAITAAQSALTTLIDAVDNFVDTEVAAIKTVTDKLNTMLQTSGLNYQFTTDALENAPAGGGGGGGDTYILAPVFSEFVPRVQEFNATLYVGDTAPVTLVIYTVDPDTGVRTATDLTPFASLYLRIEDPRHGEVQTVENADLTIDGSSNNELTFSPSEATVASERQLKAALRTDDTEDQVIAIGTFTIKYAPRAA